MKLPIFAAVVALALAGSAAVQPAAARDPGAGVTYGANNQQAPAGPYNYAPDLDSPLHAAAVHKVSQEFKMACAVDRETFCRGRKSVGAVWECIRIRRSKLTPACREATYTVERTNLDGA